MTREEEYKVLNDFLDAIEKQDEQTSKELLKSIKQIKLDTQESKIYPGRTYLSESHAWPVDFLEVSRTKGDKRTYPLHPTLDNEKMHPYIKEFFDHAIREHYIISAHISDFKKDDFCGGYDETNGFIKHFLKEYTKTKLQFEKIGREIFEPDTFKEYPFLKEYADHLLICAKRNETFNDDADRGWYLNGQIEHEVFPDGRERYWYDNGHKKKEKLIDGTEYFWHHTGSKLRERRPDGTELRWNRWNVLEEVYSAEDNTQTKYHTEIKREITQHLTNGVEDTKVYLAKQRIAKQTGETIFSSNETTTHDSNSPTPTKPNGRDDGGR